MATKAPTGVTPLYVYRENGEIVFSTFNKNLIPASIAKKVEELSAKSKTTKGMYGKLFGQSGIQAKGHEAMVSSMSEEELAAVRSQGGSNRWKNKKAPNASFAKKTKKTAA